MSDVLYAKFMRPDAGMESHVEHSKKAGLQRFEKYEVKSVSVGRWMSYVELFGFTGSFNSVQFDFEDENGKEVNIYREQKYFTCCGYAQEDSES